MFPLWKASPFRPPALSTASQIQPPAFHKSSTPSPILLGHPVPTPSPWDLLPDSLLYWLKHLTVGYFSIFSFHFTLSCGNVSFFLSTKFNYVSSKILFG